METIWIARSVALKLTRCVDYVKVQVCIRIHARQPQQLRRLDELRLQPQLLKMGRRIGDPLHPAILPGHSPQSRDRE